MGRIPDAPMTRTTWRQPEAPRPSRNTSRGTAALFWAAVLFLRDPATLLAGGTRLLEPEGRPLCTGQPGLRDVTAVVPDGAYGYVLLTRDERPDLSVAEQADAFLLHLDPGLLPLSFGDGLYAGSPCGAILLGGAGTQYSAGGAFIAPGRLAVAMQSVADNASDFPQVFVQAYDGAGDPLFGPFPVRVSTPRVDSRFPVLLGDGEGGLFFAWNEDPGTGSPQSGGLFLQRLDSAGRTAWDRRTVLSGGRDGVAGPAVLAPDGSGGVYAAFAGPRVEDDPNDHGRVRVQRVGGYGAPLWPPGGLPPWDGNRADDPRPWIVADGPEGAIVVFAADGKVRAQKMSPAGDRQWGAEGVLLSDPPDPYPTPYAFASGPRILASDDGSLFVTWEEARERGVTALVARRIERDGRLPWPRPATLVAHDAGIWKRRETVLAGDLLAVVWEDGRSVRTDPADATDVYVQAVDRRGRLKGPPTGWPLIKAPRGQQSPAIIRPGRPFATPAGVDGSLPQALVFWSDGRYPPLEPWWSSAALLAQVVAFNSSPSIAAVPTVTVRESSETTIVLHGDDLQEGLIAGAGEGIDVEAAAVPDSPDGPGDTLTVRVRAGRAPGTPPGPHDLSIVNPDGGTLLVPALLEVTLDPRRVDVDRSGRVDGYDLAVLARDFGRREGDESYSGRADIDANGLVDGADLALLAARFGDSIETAGGVAPAR